MLIFACPVKSAFNIDELVKSRQYAFFIQNHEVHEAEIIIYFFYSVLKNLVLSRVAGSSMGQACPAMRESETIGYAGT
jgi:hypothetical protein